LKYNKREENRRRKAGKQQEGRIGPSMKKTALEITQFWGIIKGETCLNLKFNCRLWNSVY